MQRHHFRFQQRFQKLRRQESPPVVHRADGICESRQLLNDCDHILRLHPAVRGMADIHVQVLVLAAIQIQLRQLALIVRAELDVLLRS